MEFGIRASLAQKANLLNFKIFSTSLKIFDEKYPMDTIHWEPLGTRNSFLLTKSGRISVKSSLKALVSLGIAGEDADLSVNLKDIHE